MKIECPFLILCILIALANYFTSINWIRITIWVILAVVVISHILSVILKNKKLAEVTDLIVEASPI